MAVPNHVNRALENLARQPRQLEALGQIFAFLIIFGPFLLGMLIGSIVDWVHLQLAMYHRTHDWHAIRPLLYTVTTLLMVGWGLYDGWLLYPLLWLFMAPIMIGAPILGFRIIVEFTREITRKRHAKRQKRAARWGIRPAAVYPTGGSK
jgi:TRAP-type C4-dicarboxylate transport system permease small subunit